MGKNSSKTQNLFVRQLLILGGMNILLLGISAILYFLVSFENEKVRLIIAFSLLSMVIICNSISIIIGIRRINEFNNLIFHSSGMELLDIIKKDNLIPEELKIFIEKIEVEINRQVMNQFLERQMEYTALQNQINPHFLYNTLDSLRGQAIIDGNIQIAEMTEKLAKFYRYCISAKGEFVSFREEIGNIKDYYYIQKYRFEDRFTLQLNIEDEILDYLLPKLTLQPIVENAINHGLSKKTRGGIISIKIYKEDQNICIKISDNGIGMSQEQVSEINRFLREGKIRNNPQKRGKGNGIALSNINGRIKLYFKDLYGMRVHSTQGKGTDVWVTIAAVDEQIVRNMMESLKKEGMTND